ncbi:MULTISPECIES: trehalose-phosphatase [Streptomyces]|uniref:trehalose-phosphatase n=1 Tax=Streptomyces TaxID=1883 RepID=UPI0004BD9D95|nr:MULTISPECIES: trehalose-phosphatase [Streptomyces]
MPMPVPHPVTAAGKEGLAALLAAPQRAVLALDFDGTLAPIVADPAEARAHPEAVPALARLAPRLCAVVVITGRPAQDAVRYSGFTAVPELEHVTVLGAYGAERWDGATGAVEVPPPPPGVDAVRAELPGVLDEAGAPPGTWTEDKGRALAVHTRRTADPDGALGRLRAPLTALAERHGLIVEPGRMVLELRPPGADKGAALRDFLTRTRAETVLYAGDDLGDLAAFAAVERMRAEDGLKGLLVCSDAAGTGEAVPELAARADLRVAGPEGLVALLDALEAAL